MKLRLSERAERDHDLIEAYTVETHGIQQWLVYSGRLEQGLSTLLRFPMIGIVDHRLPPGHQAFRVAYHWICYEISDDFVNVTAIVRRLDDFKDPPQE